MTTILTVDVGKTSCRAALWVAGDRADEVVASGAPGLAAPEGAAATLAAIENALRKVSVSSVTHIVVGAAGALAAPAQAAQVGRGIVQRRSAPAQSR